MQSGVHFQHVSKRYRIGSSTRNLRDLLTDVPRRVFGKVSREGESQHIWALNDVSFEASHGMVLGVIGHNGAGKTTALKLLSRVTTPSSGSIEVNGRVAALIELGAGFHPDLTGRENIYLNASILGLTRQEIERKFDSIVDFAELHKFIDTPVKRYSSGMYARLGFAVAVHTDPDVLVIDEVLGVGDSNFQRKCFDFIHSFVTGSKTAIFVSHNLYVMEQLCNQLIWLDHGEVRMTGTPGKVLPSYFDYMDQQAVNNGALVASAESEDLRLSSIDFTDRAHVTRETFMTGEDVVINVRYDAHAPITRPHFCLSIVSSGSGQPLIGASMLVDGRAPDIIYGQGVLRCVFKSVPLMPRTYDVWGEVWNSDRTKPLIKWQRLATFRVEAAAQQEVAAGSVRHLRADAPIQVAYGWEY